MMWYAGLKRGTGPAQVLMGATAACRVPEDCTYEEAQLVRDCLQNEPDERPSAKDLVNRLAGATSRPNSMLLRGSGSASAGHISGQLLADGRCAYTLDTSSDGSAACCSGVLMSAVSCWLWQVSR